MAVISNPRKVFAFSIQFAGLNEFLAQEVVVPDMEIEPVEHGEFNRLVKTGGLYKVGMLTIDKISPADQLDNWVWSWFRQVQDGLAGRGGLPSNYYRAGSVVQFAPDQITPVAQWDFLEAWPTKINGLEFSRVKSENTVERIELSIGVCHKVF